MRYFVPFMRYLAGSDSVSARPWPGYHDIYRSRIYRFAERQETSPMQYLHWLSKIIFERSGIECHVFTRLFCCLLNERVLQFTCLPPKKFASTSASLVPKFVVFPSSFSSHRSWNWRLNAPHYFIRLIDFSVSWINYKILYRETLHRS